MQLIVKSQLLTKNLSIVKTTLSNSITLPILASFLFEVSENKIKVTGTDLETTLSAEIECECSESINFCVEAQTLLEILKAIDNQPITLKVDKEIEIVTSSGNYNMPISDSKDFPTFAMIEQAKTMTIPAHVLNSALTKTSFAIGTDELRTQMCGVCFDLKTDRLIFVATDANKLVKYTRTDVASEEENQFILPRKPITVLKASLLGLDCDVEMIYNVQNVVFKFDNFNLICRLIDAKYPAYENVIPKNNPNEIEILKSTFASSLKRISIFSSKNTHQISLNKKQNEIVLTGEDADYSNKGVEVLSCLTNGNEIEIGFNSRFLSEMLNYLPEGQIKLSMSMPNRAGILTPIKEDSEFEETIMLVMPVLLHK